MHPRFLRFGFVVVCAWLAPAAADETVDVRRALDGDSLLLTDGRQVRLIGVNAPELGKDGAPDEPFARAARALTAQLAEGRRVVLTFDTERLDRHGRTLAYVALPDGTDLQQRLLRDGLAWFVAVAPNVARVARYRVTESEARANRRGIWDHAAYRPKPAASLRPADGGFQRVAGSVRHLRSSEHNLFFELTPAFELVVARADWRQYFSGRPDALEGRSLIARGWISRHDGALRMRISHPAMMEVEP